MTVVADALDISRQHLSTMRNRPPPQPRGRPPLPDAELVADIRMLIAGLPTYGYRRVHALLRRQAKKNGRAAPNAKRVYRERHLVECCFSRLKQFRRVATRFEKTARNYLAVITLAATILWLR